MKRSLMLVCSLIFSVLLFGVLSLSLQSPVEAAPAGPETLLSDDFEDGNADGWTVQAGDWAVIPEYSTYRVVYTGTAPTSRRAFYDTVTSTTWTDYAVRAKVMIESPIAAGRWGMLMVRWQDSRNYYYLAFQGDGRLRIREYVDGGSNTLGTVDPGLLQNTWYTLTLEVSGATTPTLRAYVDDIAVLTVTDNITPYISGPCALGSYEGTTQFDDVIVTEGGTGNVLLTEDFEDGVADDWVVQAGDWEMFSNYVYRVDYPIGGSPTSRRSYIGEPTWTDYIVQAKFKTEGSTESSGFPTLIARWQDSKNYYYLGIERGTGDVRIRKYVNGSSSTLGDKAALGLQADTWYTAALEVVGSTTPTLRAYIDGALVMTRTDESGSPFLAGPIGLGSSKATVQFDDVLVTDLSIFGLTVNKAGSGSGTVTSVPEGIDCGVTCTAGFAAGAVVSLTATPDAGDSFVGWLGACSGAGDCLVTMDAAKNVEAVFSDASAPTLVVYKDGAGDGTVTSDPAGIDCGETCAAGFTAGATVTLTAAPDGYSTFVGWSGACSGTADCVLTMDADTIVTATFMLGPFDLNVIKAGNGDGVVTSDPAGMDCGVTCTSQFDAGTVVTLTAVADVDSIFTGWSGGGCSGTGDCVVTMLADTNVIATFQSLTQTLTVAKTGNGGGLVTSEPAGINCGTSCMADYPYGTVVTLTAAADGNSLFAGWSGAGCSGTGVCVVTLDDATMVEARFMSLVQTLSVVKTGSGTGSVASDPEGIACGTDCSAVFDYGTIVTLTAMPGANSGLAGWSGGGCSGIDDCVVTVDDAITVTAEFEFFFTLPFTDDFESGADKWTVVDGDWITVVEESGNTIYRQSNDTTGYRRSVVGSPTWTDYAFQARVKPGSKYGKLIVRYQDVGHYYFMALRADNGKIEFKKMIGSGSAGLGSANAGIVTGEWYTATFEVVGNELRGYINGTLVYTTTDNNAGGIPPYTWGKIGLGTLDSTSDFDDVWVESLVPMYPLTVTKSGSGNGTVTSDPAGLVNCGDTCSTALAEGTVVTLTAASDVGDTFAGWIGACSGTGDCVLTMDAAKEVDAVFASENSPMLIVYKIGTGTGVITSTPAGIDCGDTCSAYFTTESAAIPVTLNATPGPFSEFTGWEGAGCSGTGPCYVTVDTSKSVTATFTYLAYPLTVIKAGNGSGTVTSEPPGIDCGDTCTANMGGVVTLTAVADLRTWFKGWDGEGCTGLGTCTVTMNAAKTVTATFVSYVNYLPLVLKGYPPIPVIADPLYVAPNGDDDNAGSLEAPFATLDKAVSVIVAGQTVYMRGGVYSHTQTISLTAHGNFVNMYKIWAYPGEQPVLDFSGQAPGPLSRGFLITGDYWHLKGLEIQYAQDNAIKIDGSYNIIENCVMHHNQDTGLQIGLGSTSVNPNGSMASYNQIINCDSYRNFDEATNGSNADGFACKLHAGRGNSFTGCRAWENADDGWDLFDTDYPVTIDNSWTWHNGDKTLFGNPTTWGGNGNGFKVGGNYDNAPHILRNCIAFDNAYSSGKGFDQNHNMSGITVYNSVAWGNLTNFSFNETPNDGSHHVLHNNVSLSPVTADTNIVADSIQDHNSWTLAVTATIDDFLSLAEALAKAPRQADGSLPVNDFARLVAGSDLIDVGIDVGLPYCGAAPDLGAFESCP